jgi:glycosyltransferase involved in cell wall biosynthesis
VPRISVVIPTYNRANLIEQSIQSVLSQTYDDYEIIVVDDGSLDDTLSKLKKYENKINLFCQPHQGGGGAQARNLGISKARGQFVAFLDSDDIWMPNKIECQLKLIDENRNLAWVYTDAEVFDGNTGLTLHYYHQTHQLSHGDVLKDLIFDDFIPFSTSLISRSLLLEVGGFFPSIKGTDWDLNLRIASRTSIGLVSEALARIRVHPNRVTSIVSQEDSFNAKKAIVERAIVRDPEKLLPLREKALARVFLKSGQEFAVSGKVIQASKMFIHAIRLTPTSIEAYLSLLSCLGGKSAFTTIMAARRLWRQNIASSYQNVKNEH